jgi:hypothetical protein
VFFIAQFTVFYLIDARHVLSRILVVVFQSGYYLMGEYYYLVLLAFPLAGISPADNNTLLVEMAACRRPRPTCLHIEGITTIL